MPLLILAFFVTALLYASVGFGGGSTYTALLALSGLDYRILPLLSLSCNIVVVAGSTVRFARAGVTPWRGAGLLTALAAPAALVGGLTPISETVFLTILGLSLLFAGGALLLKQNVSSAAPAKAARFMPFLAIPLGYLAGLVGIGGGIFLAPLLHLSRWGSARSIAATASLFILVNSISGFFGQLAKNDTEHLAYAAEIALPLLAAVIIGGQIGNLLAVRYLPMSWIRGATGVLTFYVGARILTSSV
ncbi:sulfite exporter TauE/SafE family protein [Qipengyuania sp. XHP0211]|uniref:sulfite exporter TauE/SafE family protein n=1 Tax=Qipengyuania sp. XHP0211 TaxID=3038079 RepID=UPI00241C2804|nr:sulfite exporter TauE/SafE family protein [Qipengyuania sp. XHP0211]MDG5749572.1 sulfite exporter TauE/SafE family protein [Qipengyuania sp. XHP0211]